jgi:hypothetical protein
MHDRLHGRWTDTFVKKVSATYPPTHPLNNPGRETTIELTIRWDGTIAEAMTKKMSGSPEFDRAAMDRRAQERPLSVAPPGCRFGRQLHPRRVDLCPRPPRLRRRRHRGARR